jgi:hypothetical protein
MCNELKGVVTSLKRLEVKYTGYIEKCAPESERMEKLELTLEAIQESLELLQDLD